jgi:UDP-glucose 4-epimerase
VPFKEDSSDLVLGPTNRGRWSYACSKAIDEFLALAYHREKRLPVVVVRFFNTVGPRQIGRYGMVIPTFVRQALMGEPLTVYGDGSQRRSFTNVADAVEAVIQLSRAPEAVGEVVNVGNADEEVTMLELAQLVKELTGSGSEIVFVPYEQAYGHGFEDMARRLPDLSKARRLIGYAPKRGIRDTIGEVIRHMQA